MTLYEKALAVASEAHSGQTDKAGRPYIEHPMRVAAGFEDDVAAAVALLHDVVEDSAVTLEALAGRGMPSEVVGAVDAITKRDGEAYEAYLLRVKANPIARAVKLADLAHNMDLSRIQTPTVKDLARMEKYRRAVQILSE